MSAEDDNWDAASDEERKAIRSLQRLAKRWPQTLRLVSMDGGLYVVRGADRRFDSENDINERAAAVIDSVDGIPNEGGEW